MNEQLAHSPPRIISDFSSCSASSSRSMFMYFVTSAWQLIHLRHPEKQV
jgi:hypothetical protein